jgi:site-specific recombinase XerD
MGRNKEPQSYEPVGDHVRIFQRGRRWHANFQLAGKQHRKALNTTSKKQALRQAIQIEAEILQGRYQHTAPPPPVEAVVTAYMEFLRTEQRAPKTLVKYQHIFNRVLDLAKRRHARMIDGVNLQFVDAYRSERVAAEVAAKTLFTETVVLRQLVNFAMSRGMIHSDPLKGLRIKKPKPARQPCWTVAEVEKILQNSPEPERSRFMVLADTGMRVGELRHLTWHDVDFEHNLLHIRAKEGWRPKTGDQRAIHMTPRVRALLECLPRRGRWVFTAAPSSKYPAGGHQFSDRHLLATLKRVLKQLGLAGHVHTFRHAFISHALTRGTPEAIVRQWVGHVDDEVIKLYTHIADESSQAAMQRLGGVSNDALQQHGGRPQGAKNHGSDPAHFQHKRQDQESGPRAK